MPLTSSPASVTAARLRQSSERVQHALTRFVVVASAGAVVDAEPLGACVAELMSLLRALLQHAGATRTAQAVRAGRSVLRNVRAAALQAEAAAASQADASAVDAHLTGMVWAACREVEEVGVTDAAAIGREQLSAVRLLRDALSEVTRAQQRHEEQRDGGAETGEEERDYDEEEDDEDDLLDEVEALTAAECALLAPCATLVSLALALVRAASQVVLASSAASSSSSPSSSFPPPSTEWMEAALSDTRALTASVDSLTAAALSPQSAVDVRSAAEAAAPRLQALLAALAERVDWDSRWYALGPGEEERAEVARAAEAAEEESPKQRTPPPGACAICGWRERFGAQHCLWERSRLPGQHWLLRCAHRVHQLHELLGGRE